jgi:hypothetical protein
MDLTITCQQVDKHGLLDSCNRETSDLTVKTTFVFLCNTERAVAIQDEGKNKNEAVGSTLKG